MIKNVLIPIDGSTRSLKAVEFVNEILGKNKENIKIHLITVRDTEKEAVLPLTMDGRNEVRDRGKKLLEDASKKIDGLDITCEFIFGSPGPEILNYAEDNDIDMILMTRSTRTGLLAHVGSVTSYVVKRAKCIVGIVPEQV